VTGKSKTGEAGRKVAIARADSRAAELAPIVADIRRSGITSWYGIAIELNKRGVPTATGKGAGPSPDGADKVGAVPGPLLSGG
jgi:hypothetical protein